MTEKNDKQRREEMPNEILTLLREIHEAITRQLWNGARYEQLDIDPMTREEWMELRDRIGDVLEEDEVLWEP